ncbi:Disease resistance protein RGA2 [Ananas comosus]|nr:Disease resistance protein RGA2 [Ananas comosus]
MGIVYQNLQEEEEEEEEEEAQLVLPSSLYSLYISSCPLTDSTLQQVLQGLTSIRSLDLFNIVSLTSLPSADVLGCLTMLEELYIKQCWFLTSLGGLQALGSLEILTISFCPSLSAEGGSTSILLPSSLEWLEIEACHWKHLDDSQPDPTSAIDSEGSDIPFAASLQLGHLKSLSKLSITYCPNIGSLLGLQELNNLGDLTLMGCPKLAHAETKLGSLSIRWFSTDAPSMLDVLLAEEALASLQHLRIAEFKEESFRSEEEQVFQHLTLLEYLVFESCSSIKSLPNNLESLSSLEGLRIINCPNIISLSDLPRSLLCLHWEHCNPVLKGRCQKPHGQDWCKISHIPTVSLD